MTIETATYISDLNSANPTASDLKSEGDDHIRLVKAVVKATFPSFGGAVTTTHTALNYLTAAATADASGQVGIGMAPVASTATLQIAGTSALSFGSASWMLGYGLGAGGGQTGVIGGATSPYYGVNMATFAGMGGSGVGLHGNSGLLFSTSGIERARITGSGVLYVGLDATIPAVGYHLSAPAYGGAIDLRGNSGTVDRGWRIGMRDNNTGFVSAIQSLDTEYSAGVQVNKEFIQTLTVSPPPLTANLHCVMNLTSNTNLRISVRGTDGTTRVANITLT
jgi:hypothetical protein